MLDICAIKQDPIDLPHTAENRSYLRLDITKIFFSHIVTLSVLNSCCGTFDPMLQVTVNLQKEILIVGLAFRFVDLMCFNIIKITDILHLYYA